MQVYRRDLEALLGRPLHPGRPFVDSYVSADGVRVAFVMLDRAGTLRAEVTDRLDADRVPVLEFSGDYDGDGDGYVLTGEDHGDPSDALDPRCAVASFKRLIRCMRKDPAAAR